MIEAEAVLVQSAQRGDRAAFEELVRRTSRLVFARLYLETGDSHQAEDLLQETLLTAFRSLDQLADAGKFRGWLLRIAQNVAIDASRRVNRKKRGAGSAATELRDLAGSTPRPDESVAQDELRQKMLAILRSLPDEYRLPLTLRYLAGADYETIQMQMGLSNGSLRGLLHRGMKVLRAQMQKVVGETPEP